MVLTLAEHPERMAAFRARHGDLGRAHRGVLAPGWQGCRASHRQIWSAMTTDTLVLEDDVLLVEGWQQVLARLQPPQDWDLVYLGGQHFGPVARVDADLLASTSVHRTHAYLARAGSAGRLLAATERDGHVDASLAAAQRSGELVAYAIDPWLAGQAAGMSAITGRRESERWWGPRAP